MLLTNKKKMIFCCAKTRIRTNMYVRVKTQSLHIAYLQLLWRQVPAGHLLLTGTVCRRLCDTLRNRQKNDMQARFTPPVQQTASILMMIIIMIIISLHCTLAGLDVRFLLAGLASGSVWLRAAWPPSPLQAWRCEDGHNLR